jgi:hypothetical protein
MTHHKQVLISAEEIILFPVNCFQCTKKENLKYDETYPFRIYYFVIPVMMILLSVGYYSSNTEVYNFVESLSWRFHTVLSEPIP